MEYKISELVSKTNTPKSTILYYIREGLLPEAKKLKSNVHRYNDEHLELIKYIKYMKNEMGSSNEQIKHALQQKNNSFSGSYTMLAPLMQTLSCLPVEPIFYTKEEFIENFEIDRRLLEELLQNGVLIPLKKNSFTKREASIVNLVENFREVGLDYEILKKYVHYAKKLSELESKMQIDLCNVRSDENFSTLWKIMFETLFNTKDYIFKRSTYNVYYTLLQEEIQ